MVLQQRLQSGNNVAHFRTVYGYSRGTFLVSDPIRGASLRLSSAELLELWRFYNGEYLVAYPPDKEQQVKAALGEDFSVTANWQHAKQNGEQDVRSRPNNPYAWWGLGKASLRLGDARAAAKHFDRAVSLGVPVIYYLYRQEAFEAWTKTGDYQKILRYTGRALAVFQNSKELLEFRTLASRALAD